MVEAEAGEKIESKASPEQQAEAAKLGWVDPRSYRGDPARFVDADRYLERGEIVLPIVKRQNKELRDQLTQMQTVQAQTNDALAEAQEALKEINLRHSVEKQRAVEEAKKSVVEALAAANEAGDHKGAAELTSQLVELNAPLEEPKKEEKKVEKAESKAPEISPELKSWMGENDWYGKDRRMTAYCMGVAEDLRAQGDKTQGKEFFEKCGEETLAFFDKGKRAEPRESKVEASRGGANNTRSGGKTGFAALPTEARAACQADTRNFVGPTKQYKTADEWHAAYAAEYFRQENA